MFIYFSHSPMKQMQSINKIKFKKPKRQLSVMEEGEVRCGISLQIYKDKSMMPHH